MRRALWVLVGLVGCGDDGPDKGGSSSDDGKVVCSKGRYVGRVAAYGLHDAAIVGDKLLLVDARDSNDVQTTLVLDASTLALLDTWHWELRGVVIGDASSPALLSQTPDTQIQTIDLATGALGPAAALTMQTGIDDARMVGGASQVIVDREHLVLDSAGAVVDRRYLNPSSPIPGVDQIAFVDGGFVGWGEWSLDDYLRLTRWDTTGTIVTERKVMQTEAGVDVEKTGLVRYGTGAALLRRPPTGVELVPLSDTLELGTPMVAPDVFASVWVAQAGGATVAGAVRTDTALGVTGAHFAADGAVEPFEATCQFPFVAPPTGIRVPRDATIPTYVFTVGGYVFVATQGD